MVVGTEAEGWDVGVGSAVPAHGGAGAQGVRVGVPVLGGAEAGALDTERVRCPKVPMSHSGSQYLF